MILAFISFGLFCCFVAFTSDDHKDRVCLYGIAACVGLGALVLGVLQ